MSETTETTTLPAWRVQLRATELAALAAIVPHYDGRPEIAAAVIEFDARFGVFRFGATNGHFLLIWERVGASLDYAPTPWPKDTVEAGAGRILLPHGALAMASWWNRRGRDPVLVTDRTLSTAAMRREGVAVQFKRATDKPGFPDLRGVLPQGGAWSHTDPVALVPETLAQFAKVLTALTGGGWERDESARRYFMRPTGQDVVIDGRLDVHGRAYRLLLMPAYNSKSDAVRAAWLDKLPASTKPKAGADG